MLQVSRQVWLSAQCRHQPVQHICAARKQRGLGDVSACQRGPSPDWLESAVNSECAQLLAKYDVRARLFGEVGIQPMSTILLLYKNMQKRLRLWSGWPDRKSRLCTDFRRIHRMCTGKATNMFFSAKRLNSPHKLPTSKLAQKIKTPALRFHLHDGLDQPDEV